MNRRFGGGRGMGGHGQYQQEYPDQYHQGHRMRNQPEAYGRPPRYDERQGVEAGQVRPNFESGARNYGGDYRRTGPPFHQQHHHQGPGRYDDQRPDMKRTASTTSAEFGPPKRQRSANRVSQQQQQQTGGEEVVQDGALNAGNRHRSAPRT